MGNVIPISEHATTQTALRAVIYLRVSTLEQAATDYGDDGYSLQAQGEACRRAAERLGADVVDEYVDRGKSARTTDRPQLQAMLRRVSRDQDVDVVIVHKVDRLARSVADDVAIVLALKKAGAVLVSATENIDETPSGKLLHGIMAVVSEFYSGNLALEAMKGMKKKAELGGTPGVAPIGYLNTRDRVNGKDIGIVVPDPDRAEHVRWAFHTFAEGNHSIATLCDALNERGLTLRASVRFPERPVRPSGIHGMLRNRYYLGYVTFAGVEYQGRHEALIDGVTFQLVQDVLASRSRAKDKPQKHPHPLKGVLFCGRCGERLGVVLANGRNGERYPYFYCLGRQRQPGSCDQKHVRMERAEDAVMRHIDTFRMDEERAARVRQAVIEWFKTRSEASQDELRLQRGRIEQLNRRRAKLREAYFADALDIDDLKSEQKRITRGLATAEAIIQQNVAALNDLEAGIDGALKLLRNPAAFYQEAPLDVRRMLVQELFEKIWILNSDIVGSDLTRPYQELLAVEAAAVARSVASGDEQGTITRGRLDGPQAVDMRIYLRAERPRGLLAVDKTRLRPDDLAVVSNLTSLVGLTVSGFRT